MILLAGGLCSYELCWESSQFLLSGTEKLPSWISFFGTLAGVSCTVLGWGARAGWVGASAEGGLHPVR